MNISDKNINIYIKAAMIMLVTNLMLANFGIYQHRSSPPILVGFLIISALSLIVYLQRKAITKFSVFQGGLLLIMGGSYLIYGILYKVPTYLMYAVFFLFQIPLICRVFDKKIFEKLTDYFVKIFTIFGSIIILICLIMVPIESKQYVGVLGNPNLFGEFLSVLLICTIYLYEQKKEEGNNKVKYFMQVLSGVVVGFILFTESRTTLITFVFIMISYIIYMIVNKQQTIKRILSFSIIAVIMVPIIFMILVNITPALQGNIGKFPTFNQTISSSKDRYLKGIAGTAEEGDITSGRGDIWKTYYEEISLLGNPPEDLEIQGYRGGHGNKANAHNTFLQVAYQGGSPAALALVVQTILVGIYLLIKIKRRDINLVTLFFIALYANVVPRLMLSNIFSPYGTFSMTPYWLILLPVAIIDLNMSREERKKV